jgi:hypothetical protein
MNALAVKQPAVKKPVKYCFILVSLAI